MEEIKARRRSPNFPALGLPRALEFVERVYGTAFMSPLDTNMILELMGFRGISGASRTALGALKQYGLVEGRDDNNRVTKLAEQIIHPISEAEKYSAILEAAKKPQIFQELAEQFRGGMPDDKVLKSYLIRKHEFSDSGADLLIKSFRDTEEYSGPIRERFQAAINTEVKEADLGEAKATAPSSNVTSAPTELDLAKPTSTEFLKVRVTSDTVAVVSFQGPISKRAIEKLIAFLDLSRETYED